MWNASHWFLIMAVLFVGCARGGNSHAGASSPSKGIRRQVASADRAFRTFRTAKTVEVIKLGARDEGSTEIAFHGWKIIGRATINAAEVREEMLRTLMVAQREHDGSACACFQGDFGIRATDVNGGVMDMVCAFTCNIVDVMFDDGSKGMFTTNTSPESAFERIFQDAGVWRIEKGSGLFSRKES
jgi:hypothetical protein